MEVPVEGEFTGRVDFNRWTDTEKIDLIEHIVRGLKYDIDVMLDTTTEVEPPERDG